MLCEKTTYNGTYNGNEVLILLFLEDALRGRFCGWRWLQGCHVLILLFLEYALRDLQKLVLGKTARGLNPSFFGRCSARPVLWLEMATRVPRLNPSFFGICSARLAKVGARENGTRS